MDNETALDLIYEDPLSDYDVSEDGEFDEVLPRKFRAMEIDNYEDYEEGELPPDAGTPRILVSAVSGAVPSQEEVAVSLDEVVKEAKVNRLDTVRSDLAGSVQSKRKRSKNKKRKRASVSRFVADACRHLREKKLALVRAAVDELGLPFFEGLINEVDVIERCGGQMTTDGGRRRTPGGVLWNILKARVEPVVYKHIMYQGRAAEKEKTNTDARRQRGGGSDARTNAPSHDMQPAVHKAKQRKVKAFKPMREVVVKAEADVGEDITPSLDNIPASQHAQNAWSEGVLKSRNVVQKSDAVEVALKGVGGESKDTQKKKVPITERLRFPVQYDDVLEAPLSPSHTELGEEDSMPASEDHPCEETLVLEKALFEDINVG